MLQKTTSFNLGDLTIHSHQISLLLQFILLDIVKCGSTFDLSFNSFLVFRRLDLSRCTFCAGMSSTITCPSRRMDGFARVLVMLLPWTGGLSLVAGRLLLLSNANIGFLFSYILSRFSMIEVLLACAGGRLLMSWAPLEEDITNIYCGDSASTFPLFLSSIWSLIWLSMSPRADPAEKPCEDRLIGFDTHPHLHLHMQESAWSRNLGGLFLGCLFSDSISLEWVSLLLASSMIWFSTSS